MKHDRSYTDQRSLWEGYYSAQSWLGPDAASPFVAIANEAFASAGATTILDLGCGIGYGAIYLAERGLTVFALDFSHGGLVLLHDACRTRWPSVGAGCAQTPIHCLQADIAQTLPFQACAFGAVYAHLSLHYFDDTTTRAVFAEIRRVLFPGGALAFCCKSIDDPFYGQGVQIGPDIFERNGHRRHYFSIDYARSLLRDWQIEQLVAQKGVYGQIDRQSAFIWAIARKPIS